MVEGVEVVVLGWLMSHGAPSRADDDRRKPTARIGTHGTCMWVPCLCAMVWLMVPSRFLAPPR